MPRRLRILANLARFDYGRPERGSSFEYDTFYRFFQEQGHDVTLFDYASIFQKGGRKLVDRQLQGLLQKQQFDCIFTFPTADQFDLATLNKLKKAQSQAISLAWMSDDKWRWEHYSRLLAPHFDYVITTDPDAVAKYRRIGFDHVLLSQWAHDPQLFKKLSISKTKQVVFIGGISAWRQFVIRYLAKRGIQVHCYGTGWSNGRLSVTEMVKKYNQAQIVLNLSNSAQGDWPFLTRVQKPQWVGTLKASLATAFPGLVEYLTTPKRQEDIKARFFEVTGSGALLISYSVRHLERYLKSQKDFIIYQNLVDLELKIRYYLDHLDEAEQIANQGYLTTHHQHTYAHRFAKIWQEIGLS